MSYKTKADAVAESGERNPPMPCRRCHELTPVATLNSYGALCGSCYADYCRHPFPPKPPPSNSRTVREMKSRLKNRLVAPELPEYLR